VATPAVLWPLWKGAHVVKPLMLRFPLRVAVSVRLAQISLALRRGLLALIAGVFLFGTFSIFTGVPPAPPSEYRWGVFATQVNDQHLSVPAVQALNQQQYALIDNLLRNNIHHIYSDYWTCNRLIFQSQERIICSVLDDNLKNGHNRYLPYRAMVDADQQAA